MNVKFDITEICNYDGSCSFSKRDGTGYGYCYGEKYGTCECPLRDKMIEVSIKDEHLEDYKKLYDVVIQNSARV